MTRYHSRSAIFSALALTGVTALTPGFAARNDEPAAFREGAALVAFRKNVSPAQQTAILSAIGARELKRVGAGVHVLSVGRGIEWAAIQWLKARGEIRYAEPDYLHTLAGSTSLPNDASFGIQWAAQNVGQFVNGTSGKAGADERSPAAWSITTGTSSVVVAVLDSGVQYSHPDLITNMWNNPGGIGGCAAGTHGFNVLNGTCDPMDDEVTFGGHGTHVAGILGATGNNAAGVAGVNWTSSIMAVKWFPSNGSGATSDLITAMDWVLHAKQAGVNVRVVNDSATWPGTGFSQALSDEIDLLGSNDILFVAAAGNTSQNDDTIPRYPCSYDRPTMICAGASDQNDNLWISSNFGITTVKLAAPGVNIYSTKRLSDYGYISGCSMAAPQISGTAALILSLGYRSVSDLKSTILNGVDTLPSLSSFVTTSGRLNVCKALPGCTSAVAARPAISGLPLVTGIPQYGSILGASTGIWSGGPTAYTYQWYRCGAGGSNCSPIPGATSPIYALLASADMGATLNVAITASNTFGAAVAQSTANLIVTPGASPFAVGSTIQDGQTIGAPLRWQATLAQTVNFVQFYIDGVLSQTASSSPYVYNQGTTGLFDPSTLSSGTHVLGIRALSSDNRTYGFFGATVTVGNPPRNIGLPLVTGLPIAGQSLATSNGLWTNSPASYAYQWSRCDVSGSTCQPIQGATSGTYTVATGDVGSTIRSSVTASNIAGSGTAASLPTAIVTGGGGGGGIALVQSNSVQGSGVASVSVTFPAANTAGNLIIAFIRMSSSTQAVAVTDTAGNVYSDAVSQAQNADGHQVHIFYARNIVGSANTVKASFSASNGHPWLAIYEYSGLSATNPLDQTAHAQGSGSTASSGATGVTITSNELLFAGNGFPNASAATVSAGSGYTLQQQDTATSRAATEAEVVTGTGSYAGTLNLSSTTNWSAVLVTFAASGGVVSSPPVITTNTLPNGTQNTFYNTALTATGGVGQYTWSLVSGTLPAGLSLTGAGAISGTPGAPGTSSFTVKVADANSQSSTKALMLTINPIVIGGIALVQSNAAEGSGVGSLSVSFPAGNIAANLIIAFVRMSSTSQMVAVTDSAGNSYTDAVAQTQDTDGHQIHIFYARNIAGGPNTVTAAFSSTNNHPWLAIYEYSGLNTMSPLDQTAHAQGSSATPNSGPAATTSPGELLFAATGFPNAYSGTVAAGGGYVPQQQDLNTSRSANEAAMVNATGSYAGTFGLSSSTNWTAVVATFRP